MAECQDHNSMLGGSRRLNREFRIADYHPTPPDSWTPEGVIENPKFPDPKSEILLNVPEALQLFQRVLVEVFLGAELGVERHHGNHLLPCLEVPDHDSEAIGLGPGEVFELERIGVEVKELGALATDTADHSHAPEGHEALSPELR